MEEIGPPNPPFQFSWPSDPYPPIFQPWRVGPTLLPYPNHHHQPPTHIFQYFLPKVIIGIALHDKTMSMATLG